MALLSLFNIMLIIFHPTTLAALAIAAIACCC
jgi:hypothetical protein